MRGGDVSRTPLPLGRAFLYADGQAELFVAPGKVGSELGAHLGNEVSLRSTNELDRRMAKLQGKRDSVDPSLASAWFFSALNKAGAEIVRAQDPVALPRARKNAVEVEGARKAHRRDGAALSRFLRWFEEHGQTGEVTEIDGAKRVGTRLLGAVIVPPLSFVDIDQHLVLVPPPGPETAFRSDPPSEVWLNDPRAAMNAPTSVIRQVDAGRSSTPAQYP